MGRDLNIYAEAEALENEDQRSGVRRSLGTSVKKKKYRLEQN